MEDDFSDSLLVDGRSNTEAGQGLLQNQDQSPDQEQPGPLWDQNQPPVQDEERTEGEVEWNKSAPDPCQDEDQAPNVLTQDQHQDQDLTPASQETVVASDGSVPALVITQAEESRGPPAAAVEQADPPSSQRPSDLTISAVPADPGLNSGSDGADMACCDLLSLKSDSFSLASDPTISRTSEDDDSTSVTASSVISLFQRVQLDPLEKDWLRSSALGNTAAQCQLLCQDASLVMKKDFITTALHWAAKQGRQEAVDMMLLSGADVNVRSGYTALHLASIHGHQHVVHALINTYNAKTNIRDYHGRTAAHYWSGCKDVFEKQDAQSGAKFSRGRHTQRHVLPSLLLTRSRSHGQLSLDFGSLPQSACQELWDLQV